MPSGSSDQILSNLKPGLDSNERVMMTQQNMAQLQHQQALQMQQQAAAQQQQANMEGMQTSQAQSVNQTQTLLVNTANLHQQLQSGGGNVTGNMGNQGNQQGGNTTNTMCLQPQTVQTSMASSQSLNQHQIGSISLQGNAGNQSGSTTITTMSTLPQQQQGGQQQLQQVQVIQQPMQNAYVHYNAQGQMLMSALHPNMNPGSIQVIAAGKPFQSNQLTSHVLSKPVLAGNAQQGSFPSYATIPTTTNQTLVITGGGQLGVISGQIPQQTQQKQQDMQKSSGNSGQVKQSGGTGQSNQQVITQNLTSPMLHQLISPIQYTTCGNGRQASNQQQVQIAGPWQFPQIPQVWTTAHNHPQLLQNPIFIRGPQQDQPMFIQQSPQQNQQIQQQTQQQQSVGVSKDMKGVASPQVSRTLSILPSTSMTPPIRPANSTSTQIVKSQQIKMRTKSILTKSNIPSQKDAGNQTKPGIQQSQVPHQILPATKMIITSQGTIVQAPIDNKGQISQVQQPGIMSQATLAMPQGIGMPQATLAMPQGMQAMQQGMQAMHQQPQLIQPKPPPLMSLSMPSLEPLPTLQQEKPVEQVQGSQPTDIQQPQDQQPVDQQNERVSEQGLQQDSSGVPPLVPQENGTSESNKAGEPMQVEPASQQPPLTNGISGVSVSSVTTSVAQTPVRCASPAIPQALPLNSPLSTSSDEAKEKTKLPKAMIKPHSQVLTHIIEGYVIQESSEPFPINRTNLLSDLSQSTKTDSSDSTEPPAKKAMLELSEDIESDKQKCEVCGKIDLKEKFKKKRFCSTPCARRGSSSGRKRSKSKDDDAKPDKEWTEVEGEGGNSTISLIDTNSEASSEPLSNPIKWTVAEVCDFIKNLPGCTDYAEDFAIQEIDGQALMLLKADHLMSAMSMKLGPALKICAKIDSMRVDQPQPPTPAPGTPVS